MKTIRIFLLVLIIIGIALIFTQKFWVSKLVNQILIFEGDKNGKDISFSQTGDKTIPISITTQDIQEENFSGTVPVISGTSALAIKMREYVNSQISEFRKEANTEVPKIREKFGADNPTTDYNITVDSKYIKGQKTESIATSVYTYTGGAHGSTFYKVMTAFISGNKLLSLASIIKKSEQRTFTEFVKKQLNDWRPEGENVSPVFADDVNSLTFNSFANWSIDDQDLTIYFDQYEIGPGVLGAVPFPLSLSVIKNFLQ
jgi:hypothetical protein